MKIQSGKRWTGRRQYTVVHFNQHFEIVQANMWTDRFIMFNIYIYKLITYSLHKNIVF